MSLRNATALYEMAAAPRYSCFGQIMSSFAWLLLLVFLLTVLGSAALLLVTVKYYWGERGTPPATGERRRAQKDLEVRLRAKQIEHAEQNPVKPRKPGFFDNRKT